MNDVSSWEDQEGRCREIIRTLSASLLHVLVAAALHKLLSEIEQVILQASTRSDAIAYFEGQNGCLPWLWWWFKDNVRPGVLWPRVDMNAMLPLPRKIPISKPRLTLGDSALHYTKRLNNQCFTVRIAV